VTDVGEYVYEYGKQRGEIGKAKFLVSTFINGFMIFMHNLCDVSCK
jgi:hypothetical protein